MLNKHAVMLRCRGGKCKQLAKFEPRSLKCVSKTFRRFFNQGDEVAEAEKYWAATDVVLGDNWKSAIDAWNPQVSYLS